MSDIKLASTLPKGEANGLGPIVLDLVEDPARFKVLMAIVDCKQITTNADTGEVVPTVRIRRIEAVLDGDLSTARFLMERALERRTGRTMLPLGLEDEMRAAFETFEAGVADGTP
jgi:hypothetical protein